MGESQLKKIQKKLIDVLPTQIGMKIPIKNILMNITNIFEWEYSEWEINNTYGNGTEARILIISYILKTEEIITNLWYNNKKANKKE